MESKLNTNILSCKYRICIAGVFLLWLLFPVIKAQGQSLDTYIEEAINNNPGIHAAETKYAISTEKITEVNTLPNTEFAGGYSVGKIEMPMMQQGEVSIMQMLPWFGTISARTDYATAVANADFVDIEIEKRKIAMTLSQSYYRLYEIAKKQEVLDANVELLQMYEQMALTSVAVGEASAVSVLRLQMRQNDLRERKLVLQEDYAAELNAFNKIMNREEVADILIPDTLPLPAQEVEIDFAELSLHPELTKFEELNKAVTQYDAVNKKESAPTLGVGAQYMWLYETPNMLMPMASVSIPIFSKKYKSISRQNKLRHEELEQQKQAVGNSMIAQLQATVRNRNAARIRFETQEKNLIQAANATEILLRNYETGTIDFREVLDVQELQLEFQIKSVEAIGAYFKQTSIINYFLK